MMTMVLISFKIPDPNYLNSSVQIRIRQEKLHYSLKFKLLLQMFAFFLH